MILGSAIIRRVKVSWTGHARKKLMVLRGHGVDVTEQRVEEVLATPARIVSGHGGRRVAEGDLDSLHVMRVVYEEWPDERRIVTMYPARKGRYAKDHVQR